MRRSASQATVGAGPSGPVSDGPVTPSTTRRSPSQATAGAGPGTVESAPGSPRRSGPTSPSMTSAVPSQPMTGVCPSLPGAPAIACTVCVVPSEYVIVTRESASGSLIDAMPRPAGPGGNTTGSVNVPSDSSNDTVPSPLSRPPTTDAPGSPCSPRVTIPSGTTSPTTSARVTSPPSGMPRWSVYDRPSDG